MFDLFADTFSGNLGQDILNDTRSAQTIFRDSLDYQWTQYIRGASHPIWLIMDKIGGIIAAGAVFYLGFDLIKKHQQNDFRYVDLQQFILPGIITALLIKNGLGAGYLAMGMRDFGNNINFDIAQRFNVYNSISTEFAKANSVLTNEEVRKEVIKAQQECQDLFEQNDVYVNCLKSVLEEATERERQSRANGNLLQGLEDLLTSVKNDVVDLATYTVSSAFLIDERFKLYAAAIAFSISADMALFLTALTAPLALSLALIPSATNGFFAWLSLFYTIQMTLISYTIMVSLMADINNNGREVESFIFSLLLGKFIPFLAVVFGSLGGMTMFSSFSGAGLNLVSDFTPSKIIGKLKPRKTR